MTKCSLLTLACSPGASPGRDGADHGPGRPETDTGASRRALAVAAALIYLALLIAAGAVLLRIWAI